MAKVNRIVMQPYLSKSGVWSLTITAWGTNGAVVWNRGIFLNARDGATMPELFHDVATCLMAALGQDDGL